MKAFVRFCAKKGGTFEQLSQFIENKQILKMLELSLKVAFVEIAVQFMIFLTFETRDKTCSKIEKSLVSISSMGGKKR